MTPVPQVDESRSVKFTFENLDESHRIFAVLHAESPDALHEMVDSSGRSFFVARQRSGWVSRLTVTVHRSQQPTNLRTALIASLQSGESVFVRDYDTAQIYKTHVIAIDPGHRTRIKWSGEYFTFELAVVAEGVFDVENESTVTWRGDDSELTPERGYPY
jgi:hypothetical protein